MEPVKNFIQTIRSSPRIFTLGVAGDSGTGKTTFTTAIRQIFGDELVSTITLDDYHLFDRTERDRMGITPLHPEANRLGQLEDDLARLRAGEPIHKPVYDHSSGTLKPPVTFFPTKIIILEGLHTLYTSRLRGLLDFTLYVDPVPGVKHHWKILRDVHRRGYTVGEVEEQINDREEDYHRFIEPQRQFAEAVITIDWSVYGRDRSKDRDIYRVTLAQVPLEQSVGDVELPIDLFTILSLHDREFLLEYTVENRDGEQMCVLTFDGELNARVIESLERNIEEQTRVHPIALTGGREYVTGSHIVQLLLAWRVINRRIFQEEGPGGFW